MRNEGKKGETVFWSENPCTDTIIPVLHHGAIGYGTDKCDLCRFYLDDGDCRTYAHGWHDRIEWTCPVCTQKKKIECDSKWQHIHQRVGVFSVEDGQTVADFLESENST